MDPLPSAVKPWSIIELMAMGIANAANVEASRKNKASNSLFLYLNKNGNASLSGLRLRPMGLSDFSCIWHILADLICFNLE